MTPRSRRYFERKKLTAQSILSLFQEMNIEMITGTPALNEYLKVTHEYNDPTLRRTHSQPAGH